MGDLTLTFVLMDPPFEASRTVTALRLIDKAIRAGIHVNVFAYEGAVLLPFSAQTAHANAAHGRSVEEEDHPLPREWVAGLRDLAAERGVGFDWVNCGLCVDERGANNPVDGVRRGFPPDLLKMAQTSINTLVVPTA